jgi:hypothetical protein
MKFSASSIEPSGEHQRASASKPTICWVLRSISGWKKDSGRARRLHLRKRADQLAAIGEAGARVGVGVVPGEVIGGGIGLERFLEVLRAAPAEQDDRDVEQEGDLQRARGIHRRKAGDGRGNDPAADGDEQQGRGDGRAGGDDVAARDANRLASDARHIDVHFFPCNNNGRKK